MDSVKDKQAPALVLRGMPAHHPPIRVKSDNDELISVARAVVLGLSSSKLLLTAKEISFVMHGKKGEHL